MLFGEDFCWEMDWIEKFVVFLFMDDFGVDFDFEIVFCSCGKVEVDLVLFFE